MARLFPALTEADLERRLLRKGVDARAGGADQCSDCGRTPLIGEHVHRVGEAEVCELCRARRGVTPAASRLVHHVEHGVSVRMLPRAA
ncbi:MAG: hypothetical protein MUC84_00040 [Solirubrobacteraceae bacterium]|jgi:hypothetical protein|nr:hypothetical protein [Solirubrobacteraceae bacterium]